MSDQPLTLDMDTGDQATPSLDVLSEINKELLDKLTLLVKSREVNNAAICESTEVYRMGIQLANQLEKWRNDRDRTVISRDVFASTNNGQRRQCNRCFLSRDLGRVENNRAIYRYELHTVVHPRLVWFKTAKQV
eukprot:640735_1